MNESVAEGISTSLPTCPSDPRGLISSEGLPSFPSIPLHVNDLGLTPPPGSQQLLPSKTTCQNEQLETDGDADIAKSTTDDTFFPDISPIGYSDSSINGFLDGFDTEAALRELHAALGSRKRAGEDAFLGELDSWNPSGKRRQVDSAPTSAPTPTDETPSLSSPDSLLRPDQIDSVPDTPVGTDPVQSPNSLFDLDALFEDPNFQMPLDITTDDIELDPTELSYLNAGNELNMESVEGQVLEVEGTELTAQVPLEPSAAELTKERFSLDSQDIISNSTRETLRVHSTPQYTSPYPVYGGRLGYLPSAPGIHVKCVEVVEDEVNSRISGLKDKVQQLTYERNKFRTAWNQWTTVDSATGKSKEQLLREENIRLRRAASQQQSKIEQHKSEAAEWRSKLNDLSIVYNNLLYEINVQRQMPAVAPIPQGYRPQPPAIGVPSAHLPTPPQTQLNNTVAVNESRPPQPLATAPSTAASQQAPPTAAPITIDLTDDSGDPVVPDESPAAPRGEAMIQSLRNKKYGWLQKSERTGSGSQVVSAPSSPRRHQEHDVVPERSRSHPVASRPGDSADEELARQMEAQLAGPP